jgi:hypothetical protein
MQRGFARLHAPMGGTHEGARPWRVDIAKRLAADGLPHLFCHSRESGNPGRMPLGYPVSVLSTPALLCTPRWVKSVIQFVSQVNASGGSSPPPP